MDAVKSIDLFEPCRQVNCQVITDQYRKDKSDQANSQPLPALDFKSPGQPQDAGCADQCQGENSFIVITWPVVERTGPIKKVSHHQAGEYTYGEPGSFHTAYCPQAEGQEEPREVPPPEQIFGGVKQQCPG